MKSILNIPYHVRAFRETPLLILFILINYFPAFSQDFTKEVDTIPVEWNGRQLPAPWTGGSSAVTPELADLDHDGDLDLFHGDYNGYIWYYENIGAADDPVWRFVSDEYADIYIGSEYYGQTSPEFADLDGDGDYDLLIGKGGGSLHFYENIGTQFQPEFSFVTDSLWGIIFEGDNRIDLIDINSDGDLDLFVGEWDGTLMYWENQGGPGEYDYTLIADEWLDIYVGYDCDPFFADIDHDNDFDLFLGNDYGRLHFYENQGDSANFDFIFITAYYDSIQVEERSSPAFVDLDSDGDFDLLVGGENINYYENTGTVNNPDFTEITDAYLTLDPNDRCVPRFADIDADGDLDFFLGEGDQKISFYENVGTVEEPSFVLSDDHFADISVGYLCRPYFCDIDADNDLDLFIGCFDFGLDGMIYYYENIGDSANWEYEYRTNNLVGYIFSPVPCLVDIDADGDYDLMVGDHDGYLRYYQNIGDIYSPVFDLISYQWCGISCEWDCNPYFVDYDGDSDFDLFLSDSYDDYLQYYENIGSPTNANMSLVSSQFAGIDAMTFEIWPCLTDIDNDTDLDLFIGEYNGGVDFYRNNEVSLVDGRQSTVDRSFTLHPNYPNPFNASTTIPFTLNRAGKVEIDIFDITGRSAGVQYIEPLHGMYPAGTHEFVWNAEGLSSGVYLVRVQQQSAGTLQHGTRKVVLVK